MYDGAKVLEEKGQVLEFYQTFSGATVSFKAFLETFNESYQCRWTPQNVFGRPDPIQTYQGTQRSLNLSWKVPAASLAEAQENLSKTSTLTRMLYPEYSSADGATTISKGPLVKVKFANLIFDASRGFNGDVRTCGLLGVINNMSWNPNVREGFFDPINQLFPRVITLTISFTALHQHSLGWEKAEAVGISSGREERVRGRLDDTTRDSSGLTAADKKINKINENREDFAQNAAPNWGSDASLFPWSAGAQKGSSTFIGNFDGEVMRLFAEKEILGGDD